jgi:hypothetical protein
MNDRNREILCDTTKSVPRPREISASAKATCAKVGFVRITDICAAHSERQLCRKNPTYAGAAIADAIFLRLCSSTHFAAQRASLERPFGEKNDQPQKVYSLRAGLTNESRTLPLLVGM